MFQLTSWDDLGNAEFLALTEMQQIEQAATFWRSKGPPTTRTPEWDQWVKKITNVLLREEMSTTPIWQVF